ncbi:hypothetical protein BYT27DRAFT_7018710, partial [Phlegmacium glaucopus]
PTLPTDLHSRCPKWERRLPSQFVIASEEDSPNFLRLKVEIETTDTSKVKSLQSLVDSGCTGEFIGQKYMQKHLLVPVGLGWPIPVYNVDGMLNEAGAI